MVRKVFLRALNIYSPFYAQDLIGNCFDSIIGSKFNTFGASVTCLSV